MPLHLPRFRGGLWAARVVSSTILLLLPAVVLLSTDQPFGIRVALALVCGVVGGWVAPLGERDLSTRALLGILVATSVYALGTPLLRFTDYPFSLTWSEGNHFWASSIFFGRAGGIAPGDPAIPRYVTSGFYALIGLPFLLPGIDIQWLRLWEAMLLVLPALLFSALVFSKRSMSESGIARWLFIAWGFLFILQGPVYAPVLLGAALVVWSQDRLSPRWALLSTCLASFYLGLSRWFWMVGPAIWSTTVNLMEVKRQDRRVSLSGVVRELTPVFAAGAVGGIVSIAWTIIVDKRSPFVYLTTLRHPILRYRLFPNPTSPFGILPWIAVTAAPVILLLIWFLARRMVRQDPIRLGWIVFFATSFLVIGLLASIKIGGGDNLHNLDLFLLYLVLVVGLGVRKVASDSGLQIGAWAPTGRAILLVTVLLPVLQVLRSDGAAVEFPAGVAQAHLAELRNAVANAGANGPVLFIDQRQLLSFGLVNTGPTVVEYEQIELMDRAMAEDVAGLEPFYADLQAQRFSLIISDPLPVVWRGSAFPFGEENDAWVRYVTIPILESYEPVLKMDDVGIWLLAPKMEPELAPTAGQPGSLLEAMAA